MLASFVIFLAVLLSVVSAIDYLPKRFQGGELYQQLIEKYGKKNLKAWPPLWWNAPIDHFSNATGTFPQKYFVNDAYWNVGTGPVFFGLGGESPLSSPPGGYMETLAKQYQALLITVEHRFYGESVPNNSLDTENYQYLTVEQGLADFAGFTDYYKSSANPASANVPWFIFGGSYPGALSSWYRIAYPEYSVGSLSSSGVVNVIVDFPDYEMQMAAAMGNACDDQIRRIEAAFERQVAADFTQALAMWNCEPDLSHNDYYYMIADAWSTFDQYGNKAALCNNINLPDSATDAELMNNYIKIVQKSFGADYCNNGFYNTKALADPERWDPTSRTWRYQTCDQVGWFQTATKSPGNLRASSVNLQYHLEQCQEIYGKALFPRGLAGLNSKFGGEFPKAHKVFYSDFSDDPWQRASVSYPVASDQPYFLTQCDGCGHCADLHTPLATDPDNLKKSRSDFERYLAQWISEFNAAKKQ